MTNRWIDNIREEHKKFERVVSKVNEKRYPFLKCPFLKSVEDRGRYIDVSRPIVTAIEERWYINKLLYRNLLQFQKEEGYTNNQMISSLLAILCSTLPLDHLREWLSEYDQAKEREEEGG